MKSRIVITDSLGNVHYGRFSEVTDSQYQNAKDLIQQKLDYLTLVTEDDDEVTVYGRHIVSVKLEKSRA